MGTSSSRKGQNSRSGEHWSNAKRRTSRFVNNTGGNALEAVQSFANAVLSDTSSGGGSSPISDSASSVGSGLWDFFSGVSKSDFDQALENEGLGDLIGLPKDKIVEGLAEHFCAKTGLLDDAIVQNSLLDTLVSIIDEDGQLMDIEVPDILEIFLSEYLFDKFISELGACIENMDDYTVDKAIIKEREVKGIIESYVHLVIKSLGNKIATLDRNEWSKHIDDMMRYTLLNIESE